MLLAAVARVGFLVERCRKLRVQVATRLPPAIIVPRVQLGAQVFHGIRQVPALGTVLSAADFNERLCGPKKVRAQSTKLQRGRYKKVAKARHSTPAAEMTAMAIADQ